MFPDDILRSRLKTVGVTEHRFNLNDGESNGIGGTGPGLLMGSDFRVFDVGGHRSLVRNLNMSSAYVYANRRSSEVAVTLLSSAPYADLLL